MARAVLVTFSARSKQFSSACERNTFYRGLYGWKQVVRKGSARYEYHRAGLLESIPHIKVDQSLFIVNPHEIEKLMDYFDGWTDKVIWNSFKVEITPEQARTIKIRVG